MDKNTFEKTGNKYSAEAKRKAIRIALEAERTAQRLLDGTEKRFGIKRAFDEEGKPVCAFGCVLDAANCVPDTLEHLSMLSLDELKERVETGELQVDTNDEALSLALDIAVPYCTSLYDACAAVSEANDNTKNSWARRRVKIAKALQNFSQTLLKDAGLL